MCSIFGIILIKLSLLEMNKRKTAQFAASNTKHPKIQKNLFILISNFGSSQRLGLLTYSFTQEKKSMPQVL